MRAEEALADKVADADDGHDGRSEGEEAGNEAVKGPEGEEHG
jgi:hypothetical protein